MLDKTAEASLTLTMVGTFGIYLNILIFSAKAEALLQGPGFHLPDRYASKREGRKSYEITSVYQPWNLDFPRSPPLSIGITTMAENEPLFSTAKD